ncbi:ETS-like protein factor [Elysia marginata]|uniref:ETS-like protein factor n=1 Tax=Elysia marginata TaxID=1093978 RepID=A0AAV4JCT8_9GAST|nr:ETS-like protein factor [Elysia marginata]
MEDAITNSINNNNNSLPTNPFCSSASPAQFSSCVMSYTCNPPPPPSYQTTAMAPGGINPDEVFFKQEQCNSMAADNIDIASLDFDLSESQCISTAHRQDPTQSDYVSMYPTQYTSQAPPIRTSCYFTTTPPYHSPQQQQQQQRRRPGRPKIKHLVENERRGRDKKVKNQHLWEFIHETLMNPLYNPQYLRWENQREGVFRFVQSEAVAQLWGGRKNNENMTYEKLSRAMRHYYKRGILERVEGRRLVYKFSIKAMDRAREKKHNSS